MNTVSNLAINNMVYAYHDDKPILRGDFRVKPEDFIVEEQLGFELSGEGEHMCLWVEKQGQNTVFVAKQLAKYANVRVRDVSYCGLKDRHGITRQWFCLPVPIKSDFDSQGFSLAGVNILKAIRHSKKLRTGVHQSNKFSITIGNISAGEDERASVEQLLQTIRQKGVPNYFGEQRFGHDGNNLALAQRMFNGEVIRDKKLKSIVISAARSYLFNQLLSARIQSYGLGQAIDGDVFKLAGSNSFFASKLDEDIVTRLAQQDIAVALPSPGSNKDLCEGQALDFKQQTLTPFADFIIGLKPFNLSTDVRTMVLMPQNLEFKWLNSSNDSHLSTLELAFTLGKGAFATSVLRELFDLTNCSL